MVATPCEFKSHRPYQTTMRKLLERTRAFAHRPAALKWLGGYAFVEAIISPIPADVLLVAYGLLNRSRVWLAAAITTIFSALGGLGGYLLGYFFFTAMAPWLGLFGGEETFLLVRELYGRYGGWLVAIGGFTFLPYKLVTIASGVMGLNILTFMVASVLSRGLRYFLVAAVVWTVPSLAGAVPKRYRLGAQVGFFAALALAAWLVHGL